MKPALFTDMENVQAKRNPFVFAVKRGGVASRGCKFVLYEYDLMIYSGIITMGELLQSQKEAGIKEVADIQQILLVWSVYLLWEQCWDLKFGPSITSEATL